MRLVLTGAAGIALALSTGSIPSFAQMHDNSAKQLTCDDRGNDGERVRHCEIREQAAASVGRLNVDASPNGGVTVKGWLRGDTLIRARVEASGDTESAAAGLASQVSLDTSGGQVRAMGPQSKGNSWWSVSYEIFVPQNTDLTLKTHNGGVSIADVRGQLRVDAVNGGVNLKRVAGDVTGNTVNGGIHAELAGAIWEGRQLDLTTRNGGVTLALPASYSAHIQAETSNGGIHSDFALTQQGELRPRRLEANLGSGGPLIHIATTNGGVNLKRAESQ